MPTTSVPLFLSSARVTSRTSEGAFTQQLSPPLAVPDTATAVRCYVESASVPFSMPNLDASTAKVVVRMPLSTATGVYDLNGVSQRLNDCLPRRLGNPVVPLMPSRRAMREQSLRVGEGRDAQSRLAGGELLRIHIM